jgi:hypothetical protein
MEQQETLSSLVQSRVGGAGEDGRMTYQEFLSKAIDPETGYRPSISIVQRLMKGEPIKLNKQLVRAIAAGLPGISEFKVKVAASYEYAGLDLAEVEAYRPFREAEPEGVPVLGVGVPGADEKDLPVTRRELDRVLEQLAELERRAASEANDSNET